jgi:hypothetical protein
VDPQPDRTGARVPGVAAGLALPAFGAAIFLSASLLFVVEPMFAKMVLPRLGGSSGVWSAAMVFFQASLFLGYAYAHVLASRLPLWLALVIHLAVLAAAALTLPLGIAAGFDRPPADGAALWVIGLFAASIGLPFFALSANAPLLQAWFARTAHRGAKDPYFLYAASNVGSFLALLSYPFLIEPRTTVSGQTHAWSLAFLVLVALVSLCGGLALLSRPAAAVPVAPATAEAPPAADAPPPGWRQALVWTGLAAVPSGLLVALTAHLSTDVAAAPFLWVVPLAIYLLTFVLVFQPRPPIPHRLMLRAEPPLIALLAIVVAMPLIATIFQVMAINLVAFFAIAMVCHGELARRRPPARHLTSFYLWMSAGGMLGGLAAGLIAPNVFNSVLEYPILIVLAVLCRPGLRLPKSRVEILILVRRHPAGSGRRRPRDLWRYAPKDRGDEIRAGWAAGCGAVPVPLAAAAGGHRRLRLRGRQDLRRRRPAGHVGPKLLRRHQGRRDRRRPVPHHVPRHDAARRRAPARRRRQAAGRPARADQLLSRPKRRWWRR